MGVFGDWAQRYWDLGMNVIPIAEDKRPPSGFKYQVWNEQRQSQEELDLLIEKQGYNPGIALVCGSVSGIVGLDFDYKFKEEKMKNMTEAKWLKDHNFLDAEFKNYLPEWTLAKKAFEGWTVFFKWEPGFKTIAADRNGVRLFDFKASGYIVVPPSLHSFGKDGPIHYKWIVGDPLEELENLPRVDFGLIQEFAMRFGQKSKSLKSIFDTRHGRVFLHGSAISKIESDPVKVAEEMIKHDERVNKSDPKGLYFKDQKHIGGNVLEYATRWAERLISYSKDIGGEVNHSADTNVYDYFFLNKVPYGTPKKDILTRKIFYKHPAEDRWAMGEELLSALKSHGSNAGLAISKIQVEFERFQEECKAKDFLVDIPEHDGIDYLKAHVSALKSSAFSTDEIYEIFLNWGYLLFARIHNSEVQNRCIIIKGNQGIGKDDWIKAMVKDFKPYYQPVDISNDPVDLVSAMQKVFVAHLSEFDQTKKLDVAFIKALITNSSSFIREKYGRVAIERPMRASWISSVNIDNMLRDSTGNRRFVVLPLDSIDWGYKNVGIKIIAQFKSNYDNGIGQYVSKATEAKIKKIVDDLTPDNIDEDIEALFLDRLDNLIEKHGGEEKGIPLFAVSSVNMSEAISHIAKTFHVSVNRVYAIAKKYKKKSGNFRYYSASKNG